MTTRADFYARKNGGGLRTARKERKCEQFGCYRPIPPGTVYFDTQEVTTWPKKKAICEQCSQQKV